MKDTETQQRFIQLRAQGWSYARIATELKVSRGTVINWSRKFRFEIGNQRAIAMEFLQEELISSRETHARALAVQLNQVEKELAARDLTQVSTSRLFSLAHSLRQQIVQETGRLQFVSPLEDIPTEEYHAQVQNWSV
jgi:transposase